MKSAGHAIWPNAKHEVLKQVWRRGRHRVPFRSIMRHCPTLAIKHWQLIAAVLLLGFVMIRLTVPCSIRGNYVGNFTACKCGDHSFLRFDGGRVYSYHGNSKQFEGVYQKVGRNTYLWTEDGNPDPVTIRTGWFVMRIVSARASPLYTDWLVRDLHFLQARRIMREVSSRGGGLGEAADSKLGK